MGILDDLKSQAEQKNKPAGEQPAAAGTDEFYLAQVKPRMVMAYDFLTQLVNQLDALKLVIKAEYPFKPEGKNVTLLQKGYKAYSDHITDPRQITLSFICILANPTTYDVKGRAPALAQGELLERYQFKYKKLEARDQNQMVSGARFVLQGPLQVKCVLQFDEDKQIIKLLLTNIVGHGTSQYNLQPEQLDESFMDHLGKYLLRKEANLFQEEISDDVKAMLRKKLQQEQLQREAELRAVEEQRKAEEMVRKQNSTTQQLKRAVSQSVAENREKLKKVMDAQVKEKGEKLKSMFNRLKNRTVNEKAPEQTSAPQVVTASQAAKPAVTPAAPRSVSVNPQAGQAPTVRQNAARPRPPAVHKTPVSPKVFQSSASNPFLKPEDFEPVPKGDAERMVVEADTKNPAERLPAKTPTATTAKTQDARTQPARGEVRPASVSNTSAPKPVAIQPGAKKPVVPSPAQSALPARQRPTLPSASVHEGTKKPIASSPAQNAIPTTQTPMISPVNEATRPAIVESASFAKTTDSSKQSSTPPVAPAMPESFLEPLALEPENSSPAESGLSLESMALDVDSSPPIPQEEPLSLEPATPAAESPAAPAESGLSLEPLAPDTDSPPMVMKTEASRPEPNSEQPALSLEDELERDLARIMQNDQQKPSLESEVADNPSLISSELDFDLSSPDALEIHFENSAKASERKDSGSKD